ncbi:MAG: O-antigen ligase family protein [Inquilinaceae bacterium]
MLSWMTHAVGKISLEKRLAMVFVPLFAVVTVFGLHSSEGTLGFALLPMILLMGGVAALVLLQAAIGNRGALIAFMMVALFLMMSQFRPEGSFTTGIDAQSAAKFVIIVLAFGIGAAALRSSYHLLLRPVVLIALLYCGWAAFTVVVSPTPGRTIGAAFALMAWLLIAHAIGARLSERDILVLILRTVALFIIVSWILFLFVPSMGAAVTGDIVRMTGLGGKPNNLSQIAYIYLIALSAYWLDPRFRGQRGGQLSQICWMVIALLALALIVAANSKSVMGAIVFTMFIIFLQRRRSTLLAGIVGLWMIFGLALVPDPIGTFSALFESVSRTGSVSEVTSFTGRTEIWATVVDQIRQSPLIGHGYGATRGIMQQIFANEWGQTTTSAHNMILQSLLDVGVIGTVLFCLLLWENAKLFFRRPSYFRDAIFILVLVAGFLESGISASTNFLLIFWFISLFSGIGPGGEALRHSGVGRTSGASHDGARPWSLGRRPHPGLARLSSHAVPALSAPGFQPPRDRP